MTIHLLSSPPFGEYFWAPVQERLVQHGHDVCIHTPIENHSTLDKAREQLSLSITPEDDVVAHGLGVPLLLHFAHKYPLRTAVLSNGPQGGLDPLCSSFARLPSIVQQLYLHPALAFRYFRSSLGMRRAVVNPYVMDADMVEQTCAPLAQSSFRKNSVQYLKELSSFSPPPSLKAPILAIWGDHDLLYPISVSAELENRYPNTKRIDIEGGKLLHPIERPWALADLLHEELNKK
jgi:pimeloyl-ACP methyl ester carboxylesterase